MRIVLDTNVLLAAFGTRGLCEALLASVLDGHDLVTSEYILGELRRHLLGKFRIPSRAAAQLVAFLRQHGEVVEPSAVPTGACRDPADVPVLGTAVSGHADLLVTGDSDLLVLKRYQGIAIVRPRECYERMH